jgi:hypothetical protein
MSRRTIRAAWKGGVPPLLFILNWYDAWLRCDEIKKVVASLELPSDKMTMWMSYPELKLAKELADSRRGDRSTFSGYVYKQLSKEARVVWERCQFFSNCEGGYEKVERILRGQNKRIRQELFLHALISSNFDISEAMSMVALDRGTFEDWKNSDFEFRQLVAEIQVHKKNFFEHALVDLIEQRNPAAVIFANRTVNADRGYGEKVEMNHTGSVGIDIDQLDLDIDTKRKILEAMRRKREGQVEGAQRAIDVTSEQRQLPAPSKFKDVIESED